MEHFRVELYAPGLFSFHVIGGSLHIVCAGDNLEVVRQDGNSVSVRHPDLRTYVDTFQQFVCIVDMRQVGTSVFAGVCRFDISAGCISQELGSVADSQYGIFTPYLAQISFERIRVVYRIRTSGKDYTFHICCIMWEFVIGDNLAIHVQLTDSTSY